MFVSTWLFFVIIAYWIISNYLGWYLASSLLLVVCYHKYRRIPIIALVAIFLILLLSNCRAVDCSQVFKVTQIKENYLVASNMTKGKIIVYQSGFSYGDYLQVQKLQPVETTLNPLVFNFQRYLQLNGIKRQAQAATLVRESKSLANWLYCRYRKLGPEKLSFVKSYLYQQNSPQLDENLITGAGLGLRSLVSLLAIIVTFFFDRKEHNKIRFVLMLIANLFFPMLAALKIFLFYYFFRCFFSEKITVLMACATALLIYDQSLLCQASFLFIYLNELLRFINIKQTYLHKVMSLIFIQLLLFKESNIFTTLLFKGYRWWLAGGLLLALISPIIPLAWLNVWEVCLWGFGQLSRYFSITTVPGIFSLVLFIWMLSQRKLLGELLLPLIIPLIQFQQYFNPLTSVTILDIGQADCLVVSMPFNRYNLVIDAGNNHPGSSGKNIIIPYLKKQGIFTIDDLIVTHDDYDHNGSITEIIGAVKTRKLIYSPTKKALKNIAFFIPDDIQNGQANDSQQSGNETSLIVFLTVNQVNFLLLADITDLIEAELCRHYRLEDFQILKLAHHGSNTSSSPELLSLANWQYALISCGRNNQYHHPSPEVQQRLSDYNLPYFSTAADGALRIFGLLGRNIILTMKGKFGIIW